MKKMLNLAAAEIGLLGSIFSGVAWDSGGCSEVSTEFANEICK